MKKEIIGQTLAVIVVAVCILALSYMAFLAQDKDFIEKYNKVQIVDCESDLC